MLIYGDLEHGSNFEYLTGFLPRFEEALLAVHQNGTAYLLLCNENLNKSGISFSFTASNRFITAPLFLFIYIHEESHPPSHQLPHKENKYYMIQKRFHTHPY